MEPAETFEHAGLRVEIHYDDDASYANPRDHDGNLGVLCVHYDRYSLGDEDIAEIEPEIECPVCEGTGEREIPEPQPPDQPGVTDCPKCEGDGTIRLSWSDYFRHERGARVVLPVSVYEHSGMTMFVGHHDARCDPGGWDTSYVGFIFDTPESREARFGEEEVSDERIEEALREEVALYAQYLEGQVYGYVVLDDDGETLDSCWGFLGDDYVTTAAKEAAEAARRMLDRERDQVAYWAARDVETVA